MKDVIVSITFLNIQSMYTKNVLSLRCLKRKKYMARNGTLIFYSLFHKLTVVALKLICKTSQYTWFITNHNCCYRLAALDHVQV